MPLHSCSPPLSSDIRLPCQDIPHPYPGPPNKLKHVFRLPFWRECREKRKKLLDILDFLLLVKIDRPDREEDEEHVERNPLRLAELKEEIPFPREHQPP